MMAQILGSQVGEQDRAPGSLLCPAQFSPGCGHLESEPASRKSVILLNK